MEMKEKIIVLYQTFPGVPMVILMHGSYCKWTQVFKRYIYNLTKTGDALIHQYALNISNYVIHSKRAHHIDTIK